MVDKDRGFHDRKVKADLHEERVRRALVERGWTVGRYELDEEMLGALPARSLHRRRPDFLAARARAEEYLVDPKLGSTGFAVEQKVAFAHRGWSDMTNTTVIYVFARNAEDRLWACSLERVEVERDPGPMPSEDIGWFVARSSCTPFEEVF